MCVLWLHFGCNGFEFGFFGGQGQLQQLQLELSDALSRSEAAEESLRKAGCGKSTEPKHRTSGLGGVHAFSVVLLTPKSFFGPAIHQATGWGVNKQGSLDPLAEFKRPNQSQ